jgi:hypothetical protein
MEDLAVAQEAVGTDDLAAELLKLKRWRGSGVPLGDDLGVGAKRLGADDAGKDPKATVSDCDGVGRAGR